MSRLLEMNMLPQDEKYLQILLAPIRLCAAYKPKLGQGGRGGYTLQEFQDLYRRDPLYNWLGLDNPLMYAAHKAAGGMTSIYRQIGIGCEHLIRAIFQDILELSDEEVNWSYSVDLASGRVRTLALDARIRLEDVRDLESRSRIHYWLQRAAGQLGIRPQIIETLEGAVFEVRQGYKSKDAKRQNADIANAATAYTQAYLPCILLLSTQIDLDILLRYRAEKWLVLTGSVQDTDLYSSYLFLRDVVGYDLAAFFQRNSDILRSEIDKVLHELLEPE